MPEQESTLAKRLTSDRFSMVPEPLSFDPAVSLAAVGLYSILVRLAAPGVSTYRMLKELADLSRCSVKQVRRLRAELEAGGYLTHKQSKHKVLYTVLKEASRGTSEPLRKVPQGTPQVTAHNKEGLSGNSSGSRKVYKELRKVTTGTPQIPLREREIRETTSSSLRDSESNSGSLSPGLCSRCGGELSVTDIRRGDVHLNSFDCDVHRERERRAELAREAII